MVIGPCEEYPTCIIVLIWLQTRGAVSLLLAKDYVRAVALQKAKGTVVLNHHGRF
jgi:hypothetical protein